MVHEWRRVVINDAVEIISGGTPKTSVSEYWGGEIPWLSVADFNTGYRWVRTTSKSITKRGLDESATTILELGDIIISAHGTVTTFYVIPNGLITSMYYLYHILRLQDLPSLGADSAVPGLNRNMAYMNKMLVPPQEIISYFDDQVKPLTDEIDHNNTQARTLASIRDALLPKLFSGEIRVKNAESFVGRNS